MNISQVLPLVEALPHSDKFRLMQFLLDRLAEEEGIPLHLQDEEMTKRRVHMASILQRMADRGALSEMRDPIAWQQQIRVDRHLPGRE